MAIYRAWGSDLVTEAEYRARLADRAQDRPRAAAGGDLDRELVLRGGELKNAEKAFTPVGPCLPLTVMIRRVYTGAHPRGFLDKAKDLLAVSAMKGIEVYDGAPRAVNLLKSDVGPRSSITGAAGMEAGTPLVFYSPALTQPDSVLSVEIVFDRFPKDAFDTASTALQGLAGIPLFAPYTGVLLAAGLLTRLAGRIGEAVFDGDPAFRATEPITFTIPGEVPAVADFRLLTDERTDRAQLQGYELRGPRLMKKGVDEEYRGDCPYVVISLDGTPNPAFERFIPTAATAALLERFYRSQSAGSTGLEVLVDAIKLYNDAKFRRKAQGLEREIQGLPAGEDRTKKIQDYNALVKNILSEELKLKELA